jgi:hypothetical protein
MGRDRSPYRSDSGGKSASSGERRTACRSAAVEQLVRLGWDDGQEVRHALALLVDIGQGGALVVVDAPLHTGQAIRIGLERADPIEWIEATVVRVRKGIWRRRRVQMAFREPCPYAFYKAAVHGLTSLAEGITRPDSTEFDRRYWR